MSGLASKKGGYLFFFSRYDRISFRITKKSLTKSDFSITGAVGIEPTSMVLETTVLPLNYAPTTRFLLNRRIVL